VSDDRDTGRPIRICVLAEGGTPAHWIAALATLASRLGEVHVLRLDAVAHPAADGVERVPWLLRQVLRLDRWQYARRRSAVPPATPPVPVRRADTNGIQGFELVLFLGASPPPPWVVAASHGGVLHARSGTRGLGGPYPVMFREIARGFHTAPVSVWRALRDQPPQCVLDSTNMMRTVSPAWNDEIYASRVAELLVLAAERALTQRQRVVSASEASTPEPARVSDAVALLTSRIRTSVRERRESSVWGLAYRRTSGERAADAMARLQESELLPAPRGASWADPFPVRVQGRDLLFFEQELRGESYGHIVCAELYADGRLGRPERVLDTGSHLSYPNVFQVDGEWFMVPESSRAGVVTLYRAVEFPGHWVRECDLLTGSTVVDPTLLARDGRWYLFATLVGADNASLEDLSCWSSPSLTGPFVPHPHNPVVMNAYHARPAGAMFEEGGVLLRPAQDCSVAYGHGLSLQQVTTLSDEAFAEHTVAHRTADWDPRLFGLHSFNRSDALTCIDLRWRVRPR
jgi:hypothetical protein